MMTKSRKKQTVETQEDRINRVRRYMGWMRNLHPRKRRRLVIDPLAKQVVKHLEDKQFLSPAPQSLSEPPLTERYAKEPGKIKAWHLHDTIYLLTDGVVYDTSDRTMTRGMKVSNQEPVIDALIGLIPGSRPRQLMLFENFVRNEAVSGKRWDDKVGQAEAADTTRIVETASSPS